MKKESRRTEILVGLFLFCGLLLLGGLILRFSNIREKFRQKDNYYVLFDDASGLTTSSPVRLGGTRIGRVSKPPELTPESKVRVEIAVYRDPKHRIAKGGRVTIAKEGLLGDTYINIAAPPPPIIGYLEPGETIGGITGGGLDALQEAANDISEQTQTVLKDIRAGLKDLNAALGKLDQEVLSEGNLENFKKSLANVNNTVTRLDTEVLSPQNTDNLQRTLASLRVTSENLEKQSTKIAPLLAKGETSMTKLGQAADSFKETGVSFRKAAEGAGKTFGQASSGDGLMNALLTDAQLKADFKNLIANLKEKGIIFYKDKSATRQQAAPPPTPTPPVRRRLRP